MRSSFLTCDLWADSDADDGGQKAASLRYIADSWPYLQRHIRESIVTLIDAGMRFEPNRVTHETRLERRRPWQERGPSR